MNKKTTKKTVIETNGKVQSPETKFQPSTLEAVWGGYNAAAKFGTTDEQTYSDKLKEMNRSDLETEARRVGVSIASAAFQVEGGVQRIRESILKEFHAHLLYLNKPERPSSPSSTLDAAALKILAEGR